MSLLASNLEAFVAIVRAGTVQQAAKGLCITQTGVTQRIRALEKDLGASLFTRSRKGMRPTTEGEALLRYCQAALELEGEVLAAIQAPGQASRVEVRILGPSSYMRSRMIPNCSQVAERFPELVFNFDLEDAESGAHLLKAGEVDLAIVPREQVVPEMDSKLLASEEYILVGPKAWAGRELRPLLSSEAIIDFDMQDVMTLSYLRRHRLLPTKLPPRHLVNNTDAIAAMVTMGMGYSVLAKRFAKPLIESGKLIDLNPGKQFENRLALIWYPRPQMPKYFEALIDSAT